MEEREEISRGLGQGAALRDIARTLERHVSTISREIRKGSSNRWLYRAARAERRAIRCARQRKAGRRKLFEQPHLIGVVHAKLRERWSPEQIAQWLQQTYGDVRMHIAAETIYTYLYVLPRGTLKQELLRALRRGHKRRRCRSQRPREITRPLEDMLSIEERPADVANRTVPGHWEGDLLIGKNRQSCLGTLVERTTRTVLLVPLQSKRAEEVRARFAEEIRQLPQHMRLTLTYDQGREMAEHKLFTKATNMQVYFAHPASPWERGTNENSNGLIRQFFPKGTDFRKVSRHEIKHVQHLLNGRPRKVLGFRTPYEVMRELLH